MEQSRRKSAQAVGPRYTGAGTDSGTDPRELMRIIAGECELHWYLPELPERGLGADPVGRCVGLLVDIAVDTSPRAFRLADHPAAAQRRARDFLERDFDAVEERWELDVGSVSVASAERSLQISAHGPWTLSAQIELFGGRRVLTDKGARRDLRGSLVEGLSQRVVAMHKRLGCAVRVVLDEPEIAAIAAGRIPGTTSLDVISAVAPEELITDLRLAASELYRAGASEVAVRLGAKSGQVSGSEAVSPLWGLLSDNQWDAGLPWPQEHAALDAVAKAFDTGSRAQLSLTSMQMQCGAEELAVEFHRLCRTIGVDPHFALNSVTFTPALSPRHDPRKGLGLCREIVDALRRGVSDES